MTAAMPPVVVAIAAVACASAAALLAPWARRLVASESRWLHPAWPALLGGLGGAGAAAVADHWAVAVALCALAIGSALLVPIDLAVLRLPDRIVWPTTGAVLAMLLVAAALTGAWGRLGTAVLAMLAVGLIYFAIGWIAPQSFGLGDVKTSLVLGLALGWHGWHAVLLGMLGGFVLFGLAAGALLLARRTSLRSDLAFGPWMILGAAAGLAWAAVSG